MNPVDGLFRLDSVGCDTKMLTKFLVFTKQIFHTQKFKKNWKLKFFFGYLDGSGYF